jgi:2-oxoisovalerate dehydrogenase E1 component alpha subunit
MTSYGEEGTHLGSSAALTADDVVYAQYREVGVLLHRGFGVQKLMDQCFSNENDKGKGRMVRQLVLTALWDMRTHALPEACQC